MSYENVALQALEILKVIQYIIIISCYFITALYADKESICLQLFKKHKPLKCGE